MWKTHAYIHTDINETYIAIIIGTHRVISLCGPKKHHTRKKNHTHRKRLSKQRETRCHKAEFKHHNRGCWLLDRWSFKGFFYQDKDFKKASQCNFFYATPFCLKHPANTGGEKQQCQHSVLNHNSPNICWLLRYIHLELHSHLLSVESSSYFSF